MYVHIEMDREFRPDGGQTLSSDERGTRLTGHDARILVARRPWQQPWLHARVPDLETTMTQAYHRTSSDAEAILGLALLSAAAQRKVLGRHLAGIDPAVARAIEREAQRTAKATLEDGADTTAGQYRLARTLERATTVAEQSALHRCVRSLVELGAPS